MTRARTHVHIHSIGSEAVGEAAKTQSCVRPTMKCEERNRAERVCVCVALVPRLRTSSLLREPKRNVAQFHHARLCV